MNKQLARLTDHKNAQDMSKAASYGVAYSTRVRISVATVQQYSQIIKCVNKIQYKTTLPLNLTVLRKPFTAPTNLLYDTHNCSQFLIFISRYWLRQDISDHLFSWAVLHFDFAIVFRFTNVMKFNVNVFSSGVRNRIA